MTLAKRIGSAFVISSLALSSVLVSSTASARKRDPVPAGIASTPQADLDRMTIEFNQTAVAQFAELQQLLAQKQYGVALAKAKYVLDQARARVGIDPKTRARETFVLREGTLGAQYNQLGKSLADFSPDVQSNIMTTMRDLRGGVYLDLLNLLKRVQLVYIECFQMTLSAQGPLLQMDINKIKNDLIDSVAIPILLKDAALATPLFIIDTEVSNDDQVYLFNRELQMYLMRNGATLGYSANAQEAEAAVQAQIRASIVAKKQLFIRSVSGGAPQAAASLQGGRTSLAVLMSSPNFAKCVDLYDNEYGTANATDKCLKVAPVYNFSVEGFEKCHSLYVREYGMANATDKCMTLIR